jgi:hypothetical protein
MCVGEVDSPNMSYIAAKMKAATPYRQTDRRLHTQQNQNRKDNGLFL